MDSVLRNYFAGGRIRKTETNVFEIRRDWVSAPQEGAGGMRGGDFFGGEGLSRNYSVTKTSKSFVNLKTSSFSLESGQLFKKSLIRRIY